MKNQNLTLLAAGVAFTLLLAVDAAPAQSGQKLSQLPYEWTFDQVIAEKIHKNLARDRVMVGLSLFEQKTLEKYGIRVGQSFITQADGKRRKVTRTSSGLRFEGSSNTVLAENLQQYPIKNPYRVLRTSFAERDREDMHRTLVWVFDDELRQKIRNRVFSRGASCEIGLTRHQQKLLQRYGIQVGHSFRASVAGMILMVKRVGLGLQIRGLVMNKPAPYLSS